MFFFSDAIRPNEAGLSISAIKVVISPTSVYAHSSSHHLSYMYNGSGLRWFLKWDKIRANIVLAWSQFFLLETTTLTQQGKLAVSTQNLHEMGL